MTSSVVPEFSRVFQLEKSLHAAASFKIKANAEERIALAKRFGLREVKDFSIEFTLHSGQQSKEYDLQGQGVADIIQSCVITVKDVPATVNFSFHTKLCEGKEQPIDEADDSFLEEETDIDYYQNGQIDVGEIAAQYLSLSLDPYPKAEGAEEFLSRQTGEEEKKTGIFSALQKLKE